MGDWHCVLGNRADFLARRSIFGVCSTPAPNVSLFCRCASGTFRKSSAITTSTFILVVVDDVRVIVEVVVVVAAIVLVLVVVVVVMAIVVVDVAVVVEVSVVVVMVRVVVVVSVVVVVPVVVVEVPVVTGVVVVVAVIVVVVATVVVVVLVVAVVVEVTVVVLVAVAVVVVVAVVEVVVLVVVVVSVVVVVPVVVVVVVGIKQTFSNLLLTNSGRGSSSPNLNCSISSLHLSGQVWSFSMSQKGQCLQKYLWSVPCCAAMASLQYSSLLHPRCFVHGVRCC